ncbi:MAG: MerR family transcriptional regulator [Methanocorpusculum sp.]|nr:MerR family transcriptional regulator [Methanocorpusculum sp.]
MSDSPKKITEIAEITGVSEDICRQIAKDFEEILPGKKIGRVTVYEEAAVDRFRKIADLQNQGCCREVIIPAIRGGKSLEERAADDMKRFGIENKPAEQKPKKPLNSQIPVDRPKTETEEALLLAVKSLEQKIAAIDQRSSAVRDAGEDNLKKILDAVSSVSADIVALKAEMHTLWDQVAELEKFLQTQAEKPFWKR